MVHLKDIALEDMALEDMALKESDFQTIVNFDILPPPQYPILYVLETSSYYKIGITQNFLKRIKNYIAYNPEVRVFALAYVVERETEKKLLDYCESISYKLRNEWFEKSSLLMKAIFDFLFHNDSVLAFDFFEGPPIPIERYPRISHAWHGNAKVSLEEKEKCAYWLFQIWRSYQSGLPLEIFINADLEEIKNSRPKAGERGWFYA